MPTVRPGYQGQVCVPLTSPGCCLRYRGGALSAKRSSPIAAQGSKEDKIEMEGEVVEALRNGFFRIALDNGHETLGYTAGKMRRYRIRIFPGDRIKVELSAYDLGRGRIVYRYRD